MKTALSVRSAGPLALCLVLAGGFFAWLLVPNIVSAEGDVLPPIFKVGNTVVNQNKTSITSTIKIEQVQGTWIYGDTDYGNKQGWCNVTTGEIWFLKSQGTASE